MNDDQVTVGNHFKLMIDGAIFSGLSQMGAPGYLDGHMGVWMVDVPTLEAFAKTFWDAGFQIHAHSNGDAATRVSSTFLSICSASSPSGPSQREHFAYSTEIKTENWQHWEPPCQLTPTTITFSLSVQRGWLGPVAVLRWFV